jgi:hypothetical protein
MTLLPRASIKEHPVSNILQEVQKDPEFVRKCLE